MPCTIVVIDQSPVGSIPKTEYLRSHSNSSQLRTYNEMVKGSIGHFVLAGDLQIKIVAHPNGHGATAPASKAMVSDHWCCRPEHAGSSISCDSTLSH